ncbi:MAG: hypothetical protein IKY04_05955 [Lachnospiraceae bacterium]|nr:hypothetical protein [Lachnospiraceae bacterium]MBR5944924.1 hypothetical protein [Lachnospiraceae bacterium]
MEPRIIEKSGKFFIEFAGKEIQIEAYEAEAINNNPSAIYDVIVSYTRKFNFNTAEDSGENIFTM